MRFCDKLAKQRKDNNLSQEQLAEKLGVSRQAVSKWESGSSYPDMEKIIQISNILNCTLENLLDDGTIKESSSKNPKFNFNNYIQDLLHFITKTNNMFGSMNFKQKIKCIIEVIVIFIITCILGLIIFSAMNGITYHTLEVLPETIRYGICNIFDSIYIIILLIFGIIIVIHLFKIRYLDYYITIEDKNISEKIIEKEIRNKNEYSFPKREKIIIRDPKHSVYSFFSLLGKIILIIFKLFIVICSIPLICLTVFLIFSLVFSLFHIRYTILFLFISISLLGIVALVFLIIYFIYNFIFNMKQPVKLIFIIFISSLIFIGMGAGLACATVLNYQPCDINETGKMITKTEIIKLKDNTKISILPSYYNEVIIDNSLDNIKLQITYPEIVKYKITPETLSEDGIEYYHLFLDQIDIFKLYKFVLKNLEQKKIVNYNEDCIKVKIYVSQENYNKIIND